MAAIKMLYQLKYRCSRSNMAKFDLAEKGVTFHSRELRPFLFSSLIRIIETNTLLLNFNALICNLQVYRIYDRKLFRYYLSFHFIYCYTVMLSFLGFFSGQYQGACQYSTWTLPISVDLKWHPVHYQVNTFIVCFLC